MNIKSLKEYCLNYPGSVEIDTGSPNNILSYKVGGKPFAYFKTSEPERWRFSFRVTPARFVELTDQIGIKPAKYMHRFHWVTVVKVEEIDSVYLKELIDWSYNKALSSLPKKTQNKIKQSQ